MKSERQINDALQHFWDIGPDRAYQHPCLQFMGQFMIETHVLGELLDRGFILAAGRQRFALTHKGADYCKELFGPDRPSVGEE